MTHDQTTNLVQTATDGLRSLGCDRPETMAFAPGRVNLIGDHTDYNGGLAMPVALDRGCVAAIARGRGTPGLALIHAADLDEVAEVPLDPSVLDATLASVPHWARYIGGVAALTQSALAHELTSGVCVSFTSSVPVGGGLSSSAAIEIATASALEGLAGVELDPLAKARWCQQAEHRFAGTPCGLLDQLTSIYGRPGHAMEIDFAGPSVRRVALPSNTRIVLLDSGVAHQNASGGYAERRAGCELAAREIDVDVLTKATVEQLGAARSRLKPSVFRYARHVITETGRVRAFGRAAELGELHDMGRLMQESHASMALDFCASDPTVDRLVGVANAVPGVLGARMTGGGFGGFVVALADAADIAGTIEHLGECCRREVGIDPDPRVITPGDGARPLPITD